MQSELKSLQQEKEEVAQQKARIQQNREKSQTRKKLFVLLKDIEAAVGHGRELEAQGTGTESERPAVKIWNPEIMLRQMANDPGSVEEDGAGGLLGSVRGLNELLKKAVEVM